MMYRRLVVFLRYWLPLIVYLGGIAYVSHQSDPTGGRGLPCSDKLIHVFEYIPVGFLWVRAFCQDRYPAQWRYVIFASICCLLFAVSDEVHQFFIVGRVASIKDVFANMCGSALGVLIYAVHANKKGRL